MVSLRLALFVTIEDLGGFCPVQGEGSISRRKEKSRFYFRARGRGWQFGVGATDDDAVRVAIGKQPGFSRNGAFGDGDFDAGFMSIEEAES